MAHLFHKMPESFHRSGNRKARKGSYESVCCFVAPLIARAFTLLGISLS